MYKNIFMDVVNFLKDKNVKVCEINPGDPFRSDYVEGMEASLGFRINSDLIEYWKEMGFNSGIRWVAKESERTPFGNFTVNGPREIVRLHGVTVSFNNEILSSNGNGHENKIAACLSAAKINNCIEVISEGNGDYIAIDSESGVVVFLNHEWDSINCAPMGLKFPIFFKNGRKCASRLQFHWGGLSAYDSTG
jgi:hypothetical protein